MFRRRVVDFVGSRFGSERCRVVCEFVEQGRQVLDVIGDDVDDIAFALQFAADQRKPRAEHLRAIVFKRPWPDDDVGDTAFVFEGHENHT